MKHTRAGPPGPDAGRPLGEPQGPPGVPGQALDWDRIEREESPQALRLARWIERQLFPRGVADFGCATGLYLSALPPSVRRVGYELDPVALPRARARLGHAVHRHDLARPIALGYKVDLGLCIEVAEHMRPGTERVLIESLARNCRTVIFSAACPGQGGVGHINCKPRQEWIHALEEAGLWYDAAETDALLGYMRRGYHMGWFVQNAFVATGTA